MKDNMSHLNIDAKCTMNFALIVMQPGAFRRLNHKLSYLCIFQLDKLFIQWKIPAKKSCWLKLDVYHHLFSNRLLSYNQISVKIGDIIALILV